MINFIRGCLFILVETHGRASLQFISRRLYNLFIAKHQPGSIIIHHNHLVAVNGSGNQLLG